jgi:hypothetical protein
MEIKVLDGNQSVHSKSCLSRFLRILSVSLKSLALSPLPWSSSRNLLSMRAIVTYSGHIAIRTIILQYVQSYCNTYNYIIRTIISQYVQSYCNTYNHIAIRTIISQYVLSGPAPVGGACAGAVASVPCEQQPPASSPPAVVVSAAAEDEVSVSIAAADVVSAAVAAAVVSGGPSGGGGVVISGEDMSVLVSGDDSGDGSNVEVSGGSGDVVSGGVIAAVIIRWCEILNP